MTDTKTHPLVLWLAGALAYAALFLLASAGWNLVTGEPVAFGKWLPVALVYGVLMSIAEPHIARLAGRKRPPS